MLDADLKTLPLLEREIARACGPENVTSRRRRGALVLVLSGIKRFVRPWKKEVSLRIERREEGGWKCRLDLVYEADGMKTAKIEENFCIAHSDLLRLIELNNLARAEDAEGLMEDIDASVPFMTCFYGNWREAERAVRHF